MGINYYSLAEDQTYTIRGNAKLLNVASAKYSGNWQCVPHTHEYTEIFYIIGGTGLFLIEDQEHQVNINDIVIINPENGVVEGVVNLSGILPEKERDHKTDVLNGIAYDKATKRIFVTGKNWSKLYEIKLIAQ